MIEPFASADAYKIAYEETLKEKVALQQQLSDAQAELTHVKEVEFPARIDKVTSGIRAQRDAAQAECDDLRMKLWVLLEMVPDSTLVKEIRARTQDVANKLAELATLKGARP